MNAIEVADVHKVYRRYGRRRHFGTLKSALLSGRLFRELKPDEVLHAVNGVSFNVPAGRTFGIIGRNGSGKSTMLKMIAGIGKPTTGQVKVHGRVSALIELGAGFHPEISGRENVFINGMMLGLSKKAIAARFDEIVAFAELEQFIDAPVKTYSSGMYMRLGFAVAINVDPDVLLVDEVLAVGDQAFTNKCLAKFDEFRRGGRTIVIVTHSLDMVTRFCEEALWLDGGRIQAQGPPEQVIDAYLGAVAQQESAAKPPPHLPHVVDITDVQIGSDRGHPTTMFASGDSISITVALATPGRVEDVIIGFSIFSADGIRCCATNTSVDGHGLLTLDGEATVRCTIDRLDLVAGTYSLDVMVHRPDNTLYDQDHRTLFTVTSSVRDIGVFRPPHSWEFTGTTPSTVPPPEDSH